METYHTNYSVRYPEYPQVHSFWMTFFNQMFELQGKIPTFWTANAKIRICIKQ